MAAVDRTRAAVPSILKAIEEGLNSGISLMNLDDIWAQAEAEFHAQNK